MTQHHRWITRLDGGRYNGRQWIGGTVLAEPCPPELASSAHITTYTTCEEARDAARAIAGRDGHDCPY